MDCLTFETALEKRSYRLCSLSFLFGLALDCLDGSERVNILFLFSFAYTLTPDLFKDGKVIVLGRGNNQGFRKGDWFFPAQRQRMELQLPIRMIHLF